VSRKFDEGRLRFEFGRIWDVEKYDEHRDYREKICKLEGTRAVDFVTLLAEELFLIEVKDLRGFRIESKERLVQGSLALELALKVRDTVSGLVAAFRRSSESDIWGAYVRALAHLEKRLFVVLWLEEDRPTGKALAQRQLVTRGILTQEVKKRLRWLTTKVVIVDRIRSRLPDLEVSYLGPVDSEAKRSP
jgi:hypothetical protein